MKARAKAREEVRPLALSVLTNGPDTNINDYVSTVTNDAYTFADRIVAAPLTPAQLIAADGISPDAYYVQIVRCSFASGDPAGGVVCAPPQSSGLIDVGSLVSASSVGTTPISFISQRGGQVDALAAMPVTRDNNNFRATDLLLGTGFSMKITVQDATSNAVLVESGPFNFGSVRNADQFGLIPESMFDLADLVPFLTDVRITLQRV